MTKKLRVGILFGGRSGEHEVSLLSAASVFKAIDQDKYEVVPIGITKDGRWLTSADAERLLGGEFADRSVRATQAQLRAGDPEATPSAAVLQNGEAVVVPPEPHKSGTALTPFQTDSPTRRASDRAINVDIIFPVLHGTFGEDGTIQGLLELADIAYVGAGVLGSAAGMDKDVMKSLFLAAGIPIVRHVTILRSAWEKEPKKVEKFVESKLKFPVFLKDPLTRKIYLNEINTMPGFTAISMYPKLWAASGLEYADLIDRLIQLGIERHADKKKNQYSR